MKGLKTCTVQLSAWKSVTSLPCSSLIRTKWNDWRGDEKGRARWNWILLHTAAYFPTLVWSESIWCRSLLVWLDCSEKAKQLDSESTRLQDVKQTWYEDEKCCTSYRPTVLEFNRKDHIFFPHMVLLLWVFQSFKLITSEMSVWFGSAWPRRKNIHISFMEFLIKPKRFGGSQAKWNALHEAHYALWLFSLLLMFPSFKQTILPKMKALWWSLILKPWDLTFQ